MGENEILYTIIAGLGLLVILLISWLAGYRYTIRRLNEALAEEKNKRIVPLRDEHIATIKSDDSSDSKLLEAEERIAKNEKFKQLHAAITTLKLKYQTVITLRYFENLSIKEIAEILDLPENTIKTHIHRGIKQLKEIL